MAQNEGPVEISESTLPAPVAAAVRYALSFLIAFLVERDILPAGSVEGIIALGVMAATVGYGIFKSYSTKKTLVAAATAAPNDQFVVVKK